MSNFETMPRKLRLEVITLGDELLLGLRENSHLTYFGRQFARYGITLQRNIVIPDEAREIERCFLESWDCSDVVITTGGLGPTQDDVTRESLAGVLQLKLEHDHAVEAAIRERFRMMGRPVTPNNLRQAKRFEGSETIPNHHGTAPGIWLRRDGKHLIMLPGPPHELYPMFEEQVIPQLQREGLLDEQPCFLQLRTCGVGESHLETRLTTIFDRFEGRLSVGYCAHDGVVDVRLSPRVSGALQWEDVEAIGEQCRELLDDDFVGYGDSVVAQLILGRLRALGKTLAVAESCTGGLLANSFTDIPGASKSFTGGAVCYTNNAKIEMLGVPESIVQQHGAVSAECAVALATAAAERFSADYALSVTGFAGPGGGTEENPVGTVFLGYHSPIGVWSQKLTLPGGRLHIKVRAVNSALDWMRRKLKEYEVEDLLACMSL